MNDNFKPIGEIATEILNNLKTERVDRICNRHIAMLLSDLEKEAELDAFIKESIKSHFRYFAKDLKEQVLDIKDCENGKTE